VFAVISHVIIINKLNQLVEVTGMTRANQNLDVVGEQGTYELIYCFATLR